MTKSWFSKLLVFKSEVTYKTDPVPTGSANAILFNASSVRWQPMEGTDVPRDVQQAFMGNQATLPAGLYGVLTFSTDLAGSGAAGTAPPWGPMLRACAFSETIVADTSVTYALVSAAMESGTFYMNVDGILQKLLGARGKAEIALDAQGIPKINWTFFALWAAPTDTAILVPDYSAWLEPLVANSVNTPVFTINGVAMVLKSYKLAINGELKPRFLIGKDEIIIANRSPALSTTVEAVPLATLNPFALAKATTPHPVVLQHGITAGNIVTVNTATSQMKRPASFEQTDNVAEWPLEWMPLPSSGNDEVSIVCT